MVIKAAKRLPIGVYIHIPFCRHLCHYCDFAKTARWDHAQTETYFSNLAAHLKAWLELLTQRLEDFYVPSLNFGGGTPSLFTSELMPLVEAVQPYAGSDWELSLEANPNDITAASLQAWQGCGFNRLSIGVQSFHAQALSFLKRDHGALAAERSVALARRYFDNLNLDLIYGWSGQTFELWEQDLSRALSLDPTHLSLYSLTYAAGTPIGRAYQRGRIASQSEQSEWAYYQHACKRLQTQSWLHEEVSNWAQAGYECRHNWLYWQMGYYLGIGSGAHGYLPWGSSIGTRYAYSSSLKDFLNLSTSMISSPQTEGEVEATRQKDQALRWEFARDERAWLLEYLGSALRCRQGVELARIAEVTGKSLHANDYIHEQLRLGTLTIAHGRLTLAPHEWFRETSWCLALYDCFY